MIGLPYTVKKNYHNMLSRFHLIPEHHGRTDLLLSISVLTSDKNGPFQLYVESSSLLKYVQHNSPIILVFFLRNVAAKFRRNYLQRGTNVMQIKKR